MCVYVECRSDGSSRSKVVKGKDTHLKGATAGRTAMRDAEDNITVYSAESPCGGGC